MSRFGTADEGYTRGLTGTGPLRIGDHALFSLWGEDRVGVIIGEHLPGTNGNSDVETWTIRWHPPESGGMDSRIAKDKVAMAYKLPGEHAARWCGCGCDMQWTDWRHRAH